MLAHLAGDAGVDLGDFPRFAFQIAEDDGLDAGGAGLLGGGVEGALRRGDQGEVAARQAFVARLHGFRSRVFQPGADMRRYVDGVALEDFQGVGGGGRVAHGGAGGDHRGLVARHVGNRVGVYACRPAGAGQAAALDRREVLAYAVHFADGGAGFQQRLVQRALVVEADAFGRQGEQGGTAAGEQEDHPVVLGQAADQLQHATGDALAGIVRYRVRSFHHLDALAAGAVAVGRDDQAFHLAVPVLLGHFGHGPGGFAGADHDGAPAVHARQMACQHLGRVGGGDGGVEQVAEEDARVEVHVGAPVILVVLSHCGRACGQASLR
ncbi:hypothetical protein D3C76_897540 [compost metagenome]